MHDPEWAACSESGIDPNKALETHAQISQLTGLSISDEEYTAQHALLQDSASNSLGDEHEHPDLEEFRRTH